MPTSPNRAELNVLSVFVAAGADPNRLAQWLSDESASSVPVETLAAAAQDMQCGDVTAWYEAAAEPAAVA